MENIIQTLEKWASMLKDFIVDNQSNPILWIGIVVVGLALFGFTYNSLSKNG